MVGSSEDARMAAIRSLLDARLTPGTWTLGGNGGGAPCRYVDGPCLVLEDGRWVGGYCERGGFDVWFKADSLEAAASLFIDRVLSIEDSTRRSVEATDRWLARRGKKRP